MATRRQGDPPEPNPITDITDTFFGTADNDGDGVNLDDVGDMTAEEFTEFITENMADFSESDLAALREFASSRASQSSMAGPEGGQWAQAAGALEVAVEEGPPQSEEVLAENQDTIDDQAYDDEVAVGADEYAEIVAATLPGGNPDLSGIDIPEGADRDEFLARVEAAGEEIVAERRDRELAGSTELDEDERQRVIEQERQGRNLLGDSSTPTWLLQLNGGDLSDQQKDRYVQYWNDAYGTSYRDFDRDLVPVLSRFDGTEAEAQNMTSAVLAEQEPMIARSITVPLVNGVHRVSYTEEELDDLRAMGFSNDAITRLVRVAGMSPKAVDAIRQGAAGDTLEIGPLAALVRYYGGGSEFAGYQQRQQNISEIEQSLGLRPGGWARLTAKERQAFREQKDAEWRATLPSGAPSSSFGEGPGGIIDRLEELTRAQGRREDHTLPGILAANNNFQRGLEAYRGDQFLALIHAIDPNLAQRVAAHDDPDEPLDWRDNEAVYNILEQSGAIEGSSVRLRQLEDARGFFGYFAAAAGGGGGGGRVRPVVDPESVREALRSQFAEYFLPTEPSDALVSEYVATLQAAMDAAPEGMNVDVTSRLMQMVRARPEYQELYQDKPAGLTEQQYAAQFAAGVQDVIGNELDPEAIRAGMRGNDYNTAVGRAASSERLLTNSTLRGRWAQAKQTLDRFS